jgi:cell division protein FtsQ
VDRSVALRLPRPAAIPLPHLPRRPLRALAVTLLVLALLGGGWLWLRNSSLVSVEKVEVTGIHGAEGHAVRVALDEAAQRMSTLHVNMGALRAAVAPFRVVQGLKVSSGFPHTLRIRVIERPPVAALTVDGVKTAAAADGVVLGPALLTSRLPVVQGAGSESLGGGQVKSPETLAALAVLGAAPPALVGWVARVYTGKEGLTVTMRNGLAIYFGDATRVHAKWLSAARVLADPSSQGAWYVDVRLPERPAVGLAGSASSGSEEAPGQVSASDPTAASLAASLAEAVSSAPAQPASAPSETQAQPASASSGSATQPASASAGTAAQSEATSSGTAAQPETASSGTAAQSEAASTGTGTRSSPSSEVSSSTGG